MNNVLSPKVLLRVEGLLVFLVALFLYRELGTSWWMFALLFLVPDVSMLGYVANTSTGAATYNLIHTYTWPLILYAGGFAVERRLWMALALIWAAHLGFDRVLGFGLKYVTAFRDTHLDRV